MMKKVAFIPYSTPVKWISNTAIAHNKIWSWLVMEMARHGGYNMSLLTNVDPVTAVAAQRHGCKVCGRLRDQDYLVVLCGYFTPVVPGSAVMHCLETLRDFHGTVIYITCDYLLHFNPSVSRYGRLLKEWPDDALTAGKRWRYVLHASAQHHFKSRAAIQRFCEFPNLESVFATPELNMAGTDPDWKRTLGQHPTSLRHGTMYCGAYRPDRRDFFVRYFCQPESRAFVVSTSGEGKFKALPGFSATTCGPIPGKVCNAIQSSCVQIIGCDAVDNHPETPIPTRYWEAVSAGVPVVFDRASCSKWKSLAKVPTVQWSDGAADLCKIAHSMKTNPALRARLVKEQASLLDGRSFYDRWNVKKWFA